jgi:hypothetical protein
MRPKPGVAVEHARSAPAEEIKSLVHETGEEILLALIDNPNLTEAHVISLLGQLDLSATVLGAVAGAGKWASSESIRLRLAQHPRTPKRFALPALRQLFLFDLVRLSLLPSSPADIRRTAEEIIVARLPHLPVGEKLTLARRGPPRVAGALLAEGHAQSVKLALANPFLTEGQVLKVLAKPAIPERVVAAIAQHPRWSCQYNVRMALIRHQHTPVAAITTFLPDITLRDLREIMRLDELAPHLRKYIDQELARRAAAGKAPPC